MKSSLILLALTTLIFASCSTAYKTGQTPDDVYYSPAKPAEEYVVVDKQDDRAYSGSDYYEDRYIRMRIQNRYQWSALDDYYFNNAYAYNAYGNYNSWNSPWNSYWTWNNYYNPYCGGGVIIKNPSNYRPPSRPIAFNTASYGVGGNGLNAGRANYHPGAGSGGSAPRYNNSNNSSSRGNGNSGSLGNSIRRVFGSNNSNSSSNSSNNNSTPTRSYDPSSSSSRSTPSSSGSSSSGSSSSGGGVSRPNR